MIINVPTKGTYKKELTHAAGVSSDCLRIFLAQPEHREALRKMGVKPTAHLLPPIAAQYVIDHYIIAPDD